MDPPLARAARLRAIPAVEKVISALGPIDLPRPLLVALVRRRLSELRAGSEMPSFDTVMFEVRAAVEELRLSRIQPVINGTGIIIHTNLGRAPLSSAAVAALTSVAASYNNLEYDLASGQRGGRADYLEQLLAVVCGADAATVVNNCAAALTLILGHFTARKPEVIISRGELIQIGGGFRIPDILESSGAKLREVGTTNKTALQDYAEAITPATGMILKVHRSNFFMSGFVESPPTAAIAGLARARRIPFVEDLGSGAVMKHPRPAALADEPTPRESLKAGVPLVCFSGDKLFGGPQAGVIAGKGALISALKRAPLFRALRCDKLVFAALQATAEAHLEIAEQGFLPVVAMIATPVEVLRARAVAIVEALQTAPVSARIGTDHSQLGGGSSPQAEIPSVTIELTPSAVAVSELAARLRRNAPPVIGSIGKGKLKLDLRTIFPWQDEAVIAAVCRAC